MIVDVNGEKQYLNIRGRIDRIDKINDNTIEVIDYKSGSRNNYGSKERGKKDEISLKTEIQPRAYHIAAKYLYPWADNVIATFIYITDGGPVSIPFCDTDLKETYDMIKKRYFAIKNNDNPSKTPDKWKCKMCSFYHDNTCQSVHKEMNECGYEFVTQKYQVLNYDSKRFRK